ncbi:alpha/beta fold hydrolase [Actinocrispum wychmicini]|uniref:Pimeloyl-ACP methyl ester carboxylesterase n=1 Tax=Actinocrispum wychmicini TaxID=1213861 RepID=A0A4R2J327_9PSEU|nr:alpha/beta hydrolase [Actinocrispum wychmicini]TCO49725.1 pimeloyl-ACP methyl ester carboxylesterase [Actinocrispum wychmicini]
MPVVLVHGVPEAAAVWGPLRAELGRADVITLSPPGFGAPVPSGFGATADDYARWLVAELEAVPGPIDLVGHDWGGLHVQRVAATRPDLIRSWATDVVGAADPEYVWHPLAQTWQTDGAGETAVNAMVGLSVEERAAAYVPLGMTPEAARACAEAMTEDMARCILALYRSAKPPAMAEWGRDLERAERRRGLAIVSSEDPCVGGETLARRAADRFGSQVTVLDGLGHWWMLQDPARGAKALAEFLADY